MIRKQMCMLFMASDPGRQRVWVLGSAFSQERRSSSSSGLKTEAKRKGAASIEAWIDENMKGKSCVVVLVGSETALRPWVLKEIVKGWSAGKGVLGIPIDKLLETQSQPSRPGPNPFDMIDYGTGKLSSQVELITPQGWDSKVVYADIHANMERWIETAIRKRNA